MIEKERILFLLYSRSREPKCIIRNILVYKSYISCEFHSQCTKLSNYPICIHSLVQQSKNNKSITIIFLKSLLCTLFLSRLRSSVSRQRKNVFNKLLECSNVVNHSFVRIHFSIQRLKTAVQSFNLSNKKKWKLEQFLCFSGKLKAAQIHFSRCTYSSPYLQRMQRYWLFFPSRATNCVVENRNIKAFYLASDHQKFFIEFFFSFIRKIVNIKPYSLYFLSYDNVWLETK